MKPSIWDFSVGSLNIYFLSFRWVFRGGYESNYKNNNHYSMKFLMLWCFVLLLMLLFVEMIKGGVCQLCRIHSHYVIPKLLGLCRLWSSNAS
jgi:hypothetical protein